MQKSSANIRRWVLWLVVLAVGGSGLTFVSGDEPLFRDLLGTPQSTSAVAKKTRPITFDVRLVPGDGADRVVLRIDAKMLSGHYTYSTNPGFGAGTKIKVDAAPGLTAIDDEFQADRKPKIERELVSGDEEQEVEKFYEQVTWSRRYRIEPGAVPTAVALRGSIKTQVCSHKGCMPQPAHTFEVTLNGSAAQDGQPTASTNDAPQAAGTVDEAPAANDPTVFTRLVGKKDNPQVGATWTVSVQPKQVQPGDTVTVSVKAVLGSGWHLYALDQAELPDGGGPLPTAIVVEEFNGLKPLGYGFVGPSPVVSTNKELYGDSELRHHEGEVIWTRKYEVPASAKPGSITIAGQIGFQICTDFACESPTGMKFHGQVVVSETTVDQPEHFVFGGTLKSAETKQFIASARPAAPKAAMAAIAPAPAGVARGGAAADGLMAFLLAAITAGFASLLTPCVFPMIPITVSFFLKQSDRQHHKPITMASVYCGGIIATFTVLGFLMSILFGAASLNTLANNAWLNVLIALVMVVFGMNLLGLFEIHIPNFLLSFTSEREGRGGLLGTLFMSLTFTLTSFTCTFAFVGLVLVTAANGEWFRPLLGLLVFSAAFSLPFFFLALFPSLLRKLPKGGGWLNAVKVTMGLLEIGAAFKFLSVTDQAWHPVAWVFDYELVMVAWMVLSIVTGCYLFGQFQLPHDTPTERIGVLRLMSGISFWCLAGYLAVGLFAPEKPTGKIWGNILAFAPPKFHTEQLIDHQRPDVEMAVDAGPSGPVLIHGGLKYALDFDQARAYAKKHNQPLFLDFTGVNCANCRFMEKGPMSKPDVVERLRKLVRVQLFADNVPTVSDPVQAEKLLEKNRKLQEGWFGSVTLPSYAVVLPDGDTVLARYEGAERKEGEFAKFLDEGISKWEAQQAGQMIGLNAR
ncbi:MAG: thioredoxin fold domain-containing protein [Planctomycetales bacterium]|nr:thioredoxin fold domain-containing protein [Planctomycetales bacterium]